MGKLFTLDAATKAVIQDALDDIIAEFGKNCRVVYPARWAACVNCVNDPVGRKSANRWRHGGPLQFPAGTPCPLCSGQGGHQADAPTEDVRLKVEWEPLRFWVPFPGLDLRAPHSVCQTKGFVWDLPRLQKADHLLVQLPVEPYVQTRMRAISSPVLPGNIIQDRYVIMTWEAYG